MNKRGPFVLGQIWIINKTRLQNKNFKKEAINDKIGRIRDFEIDKKGDIFIIVDEKDASL